MLSPEELQFNGLSPEQRAELLPSNLLFLGYRGSIAHGMYTPKHDPNAIDDKDIMGVFVGTKEHYLGFGRRDVHEKFIGEWDAVSYEIRKLFLLLLKGNPNVLSLLWLDPKHVLYQHPLWERVIAERHLFVAKSVYRSFTGYAYEQLKKMTAFGEREREALEAVDLELNRRGIDTEWAKEVAPSDVPAIAPEVASKEGDDLKRMDQRSLIHHFQKLRRKYFSGYMGEKRRALVTTFGYDTKNAAHCIRLLRMSIEFLSDGKLSVERRDASELLDIKNGGWTVEKVQEEADRLSTLANEAYERCTLPADPDSARAEELLVEIIRSYHSI